MGQTQSRGIGVLNLSEWEEINVGLSMGRTHYFENGVKKGQVSYRWPGAVFYTVYVYPRQQHGANDITHINGHSRGEKIFKLMNCYAGGRGTWIIVRGGVITDENGKLWPSDLELTCVEQEEVFQKGTFTLDSHKRFHSCERRCTDNCSFRAAAETQEKEEENQGLQVATNDQQIAHLETFEQEEQTIGAADTSQSAKERRLDGDSLHELIKILHNTQVPGNWKLFGVMLKIPLGSLNTIAAKHPQQPANCLIDVLELWLKRMVPPPSWEVLIEALQILGEEKVASELRKR